MNIKQWLDGLRSDPQFMANVTHWVTQPPRAAQTEPFPDCLDTRIAAAYARRKVTRLYTHQADAVEAVARGENIVVVTPTASGKTMCYNLPVLDAILKDESARALYLFPTKALSADQVSELYEVIEESNIPVKTYTYDGDTPGTARKAIRQAGHIVVTNPDMLHSGILPNHTKWVRLFENLRFVVIDEVHSYRGVFGSHLANVIRRLRRICAFYGSNPQFICCSATIANPDELAASIIGAPVTLINRNGAPQGERHMIFYNPPVVNRQLGIRKSSVMEARTIATQLILNRISTIVFARSRLIVEVLTTYLKELVRDRLGQADTVRGYRGGYLPTQRRQIERGLREGSILGVVSTNALELGIDIGSLEACVLCGYPGTVASTWQQAGRAGRRNGVSATFYVANSSPLDQFIVRHPEYFFEHSPENGLINPDNIHILVSHLKCALFELAFKDGERYGEEDIGEILDYLQESGILRHVGDTWYWAAEEFPASGMSLRNASDQNFAIIDITTPDHKVIGEMDRFTVPMLLHEEAVYLHEGRQYQVEKLDFPEKKAYIRSVDVDYYTDANLSVSLRVLDVLREKGSFVRRSWGEVLVTAMVTMYKKIKFDTHENIGWGQVRLPEMEMHTTSYWLAMDEAEFAGCSSETMQNGLMGVANLLANIIPIYLMCDVRDISVQFQVKSPFTQHPTVYVYDSHPGGIGLSEKLFALDTTLFEEARTMLNACPCLDGCPSCVGPDAGDKRMTLRMLDVMLHDSQSQE